MSRRPYTFLNYPGGTPGDSEHASRLAELLEFYGLDTWVAARDREHFADNHESVLQSLNSSAAFVACLGTRQLGRGGIKEIEVASARAEEDPTFPIATVLLPGSLAAEADALPLAFKKWPTIDMRTGVVVNSVAPLVAILWRALNHERAPLLDEIEAALRRGSPVALTGPPGSGKSALAAVVASQVQGSYPDGFATLSVDPERDVARMVTLVMRALNLPGADSSGNRVRTFREETAAGRYLIVFDGIEIEDVTDLVPLDPSVVLLVSRQKLKIRRPHIAFEIPGSEHPAPPSTTPPAEAVTTRPGYNSDLPDGVDLLRIDQPVRALCSVIAAKDVKPPLSIGLFGEWGAGKTFFIGKMQRQIAALAAASEQAPESAYCSSIRQIVFNAWHYADANLWASLASRVFEGLAGEETESERLFETLASSRLQLQEATAEQEVAQRALTRAREEEERAKRELTEARLKLQDLAKAGVDILDEIEDPSPLLVELRTVLHLAPDEEFGLAAAKSIRTTRGAIAELWRRSKGLLTLFFVAVVAATAFAIFAPTAWAIVLSALAAIGLGVRLAAGPLQWVLRAKAEARKRSEALLREENARLGAELEELRQREREARRRQDEAQRQVDEAEHEITEIKDGRRLFQFIAERSRGDAYEPYLGLMALVRRDFERLSALIEEHTESGDGAMPQLERIVLYIDDLDRCPGDRVIEVLEAVHLLMASKLFVVVVAVDPRWLLSSLERHYAKEIRPEEEARWSPTPQDYLEKIFQIPFTLPPMEGDGFRRLVEASIQVEKDRDGTVVGGFARGRSRPSLPRASGRRPSPPKPREEEAPEPVDLHPAGLLVTAEEVAFMSKLGPVVRTPRSTKRLTNLYRLSRASLFPAQLDELLGRRGGVPAYPALQLMLAMLIGFPGICPRLLAALKQSDQGLWWDFVDDWESPPGEEASLRLLLASLAPLRSEPLPDRATFARLVPQVARYSYEYLHPDPPGNGQ